MTYEKILFLAPHTDDIELGCGATVAKFVQEGKEVYCAAFSIAEDSVPKGFARDALASEFQEAMNVLGVPHENLSLFKYPVRRFPNHRQEILEELVKFRRNLNPDLVFLPSLNDVHQDHQVLANEGLRAFKKISILGYELPWNNISFETRCFIPITRQHLEAKINALEVYKTQKHRSYLSPDFIRGLATVRGTQFESEFAESFEVVRLIL